MELDTSRLDLNLLAALDVLLRERNVTRAAKRLGITQSAMSHKLKRLREELDDPLFVTAPGGLVPTARAESLEEPLRRALQDVAAAVRASAPFDPSTAEREVRVACVDAIELTLLPDILARLARDAPKVRLSIRRRGPRSMDELASGELDLIVAPGGVSTRSGTTREATSATLVGHVSTRSVRATSKGALTKLGMVTATRRVWPSLART